MLNVLCFEVCVHLRVVIDELRVGFDDRDLSDVGELWKILTLTSRKVLQWKHTRTQ